MIYSPTEEPYFPIPIMKKKMSEKVCSKDGRYEIVYGDSFGYEMLDIHKENGETEITEKNDIYLLENGTPLWHLLVTGFFNVAVSDTGNTIISHRERYDENTTVSFVNQHGVEEYHYKFTQSIYHLIKTADDSRVSFFCYPERNSHEDFSRLCILSFLNRENDFEVLLNDEESYYLHHPESIEIRDNTIEITDDNGICLICDFTGKVLNLEDLEKQDEQRRRNSNLGYDQFDIAEEKLFDTPYEEMTPEDQADVRLLYQKALINNNMSDNVCASIYKQLGDFDLFENNLASAICNWEKALSICPKYPIKRKLAALKKQLIETDAQ